MQTPLLKPASFSLLAGECVVVHGPSGGGKTLLLRAIADLDPSEGVVCLNGRDRTAMSGPEWRRRVGYLPAEPGWWADTVGEHFTDWTMAFAVAREFGFPDGADDWPIARLSTGERLRLALVRALMMRPEVLLLDEPTAALDPVSVAAVESLIAERLKKGLGVLWVTHDKVQSGRIAARGLLVSGGLVQEEVSKCRAISR
ncbi:MAG: ATP-binding cassette domain-containing protein [Alphaproteobacteria bacterium]|nr:ATP-binding cassette domain-containing protein [Alphaproteobacteria bacterium]